MLKPLAILLGCLLVAGGGTYALYTQIDMLSGGGCKGGGCPISQALSSVAGCCSSEGAEPVGCCSADEQQLACAAANPASALTGPALFAVSAKAGGCCEAEAPQATGADAVAGVALSAVKP